MSELNQRTVADAPTQTVDTIASQLIGVWVLKSYTEERDGGGTTHPFGPEPQGYLIYTASGFVSAQLMNPMRPLFRSLAWNGGTAEEYFEAGRGYIAYCGTYEVDEVGGTVTHIPKVSLLPNLVSARELRSVDLQGDCLVLATATTRDSEIMSSRLEWRRVR